MMYIYRYVSMYFSTLVSNLENLSETLDNFCLFNMNEVDVNCFYWKNDNNILKQIELFHLFYSIHLTSGSLAFTFLPDTKIKKK